MAKIAQKAAKKPLIFGPNRKKKRKNWAKKANFWKAVVFFERDYA